MKRYAFMFVDLDGPFEFIERARNIEAVTEKEQGELLWQMVEEGKVEFLGMIPDKEAFIRQLSKIVNVVRLEKPREDQ